MTATIGVRTAVLAADSSLARSLVPGASPIPQSIVAMESCGLAPAADDGLFLTNTREALSIASCSLLVSVALAVGAWPPLTSVGWVPGWKGAGCHGCALSNGGTLPRLAPGLGLACLVAVRPIWSGLTKLPSVSWAGDRP